MNDAQEAHADTPSSSETPTRPATPTARRWSVRTLAATAITAVALSGAGGAALASVSEGASSGGRPGGFGGPPPGMTGQRNGQLLNGTRQRPQRPAIPRPLPVATDPATPERT